MNRPQLIAEIGGTWTRLAIDMDGKRPERLAVRLNDDYPGPKALLEAYLQDLPASHAPVAGTLAVAGPVSGNRVRLTNRDWDLDGQALATALGLDELSLCNDYAALARALPILPEASRRKLGGGTPDPRSAMAVLGPGTGLGVAGIIPYGDHWVEVVGEGGHVTLAPADAEESGVLDRLRAERGHVSAEDVLSGPGLVHLYRALGGTDPGSPREISRAALEHREPLAGQALELFLRFLGTVAGDLALTLGARAGVFLAGGILPALGDAPERSGLHERFVGKGRYRPWLEEIPLFLITDAQATLYGLLRR